MTVKILPRLQYCPVCGCKPWICGSYPAYTILGNDSCPLCKKVCNTAITLEEAYHIWNSNILKFIKN